MQELDALCLYPMAIYSQLRLMIPKEMISEQESSQEAQHAENTESKCHASNLEDTSAMKLHGLLSLKCRHYGVSLILWSLVGIVQCLSEFKGR